MRLNKKHLYVYVSTHTLALTQNHTHTLTHTHTHMYTLALTQNDTQSSISPKIDEEDVAIDAIRADEEGIEFSGSEETEDESEFVQASRMSRAN
jgi:hypothetical protein